MRSAESYRYCLLVLRRMGEFHTNLRGVLGVIGPHFKVSADTVVGRYHQEYQQILEEYLVGCQWITRHHQTQLAPIYLHYPWQHCEWNVPDFQSDPRWQGFVDLINRRFPEQDEFLQEVFDRHRHTVAVLLEGNVTPSDVVMFRLTI